MRALARRAGCAHTNINNYFASWDALRWAAIAACMQGLLDLLPPEAQAGSYDFLPPPGHSGNLLEVYLRYGLEHPHRYRFIWLDPVTGTAPAEVEAVLQMPGRIFFGWLERALSGARAGGERAPAGVVHNVGRHLHAYMHEELAFLVTGRSRSDAPTLSELVNHTTRLYETLSREMPSTGMLQADT